MARGRMLNKKVSRSLQFDQLPDDTCRLLATWTISHLDVNGVFYADPVLVRSLIFPRRTDITAERVESYLIAMENVGLIVRYRANGDVYQHWPGFRGNQVGLRVDREKPDYPPPPATLPAPIPQDAGTLPDNGGEMPAEHEVKGSEVKESEAEADPSRDEREACRLFVDTTGAKAITGIVATDIVDLIKETETFRASLPRGSPGADVSGGRWVCEAIKEMARANPPRKNVKYVSSIITRWRNEGYMSEWKGSDNGNRGADSEGQRDFSKLDDLTTIA